MKKLLALVLGVVLAAGVAFTPQTEEVVVDYARPVVTVEDMEKTVRLWEMENVEGVCLFGVIKRHQKTNARFLEVTKVVPTKHDECRGNRAKAWFYFVYDVSNQDKAAEFSSSLTDELRKRPDWAMVGVVWGKTPMVAEGRIIMTPRNFRVVRQGTSQNENQESYPRA